MARPAGGWQSRLNLLQLAVGQRGFIGQHFKALDSENSRLSIYPHAGASMRLDAWRRVLMQPEMGLKVTAQICHFLESMIVFRAIQS